MRVFWWAAAMAGVLAASNYLVRFSIGEWLTWAAFSYPLAFLVTDCANNLRGAAFARRVVYAGFAAGLPLSFCFIYFTGGGAISAAHIAASSGAAFLAGQILDVAVFDKLRRAAWWRAPFFSSAAGSVIDTAIFFGLAFGLVIAADGGGAIEIKAATDGRWLQFAAGDLGAKAAMVFLLLPPYRAATSALVLKWRG
jgi:uncharacterized PurR-regulated membrane protein YhhQ (DUF165 family)